MHGSYGRMKASSTGITTWRSASVHPLRVRLNVICWKKSPATWRYKINNYALPSRHTKSKHGRCGFGNRMDAITTVSSYGLAGLLGLRRGSPTLQGSGTTWIRHDVCYTKTTFSRRCLCKHTCCLWIVAMYAILPALQNAGTHAANSVCCLLNHEASTLQLHNMQPA